MKKITLATIVIALALLTCVYTCSAVTTVAASDVTSSGATLNGVADAAGQYCFEWSSYSGGYTLQTENITAGAGAAFSYSLSGMPISSGTTFYFRAVNLDTGGTGSQLSFTAGTVTAIPTTTYEERYYDPFVETKWNMAALAEVVPTAYTDKWGIFIWALFWGALMVAFWIRQEDVTIPAFLYIIVFISLSLSQWIPVEMMAMAYLMLVVSFGGIIVSWFHGRKNG